MKVKEKSNTDKPPRFHKVNQEKSYYNELVKKKKTLKRSAHNT